MCGIAGWFENIDFERTNKVLKVLKPGGLMQKENGYLKIKKFGLVIQD